MRTFTVLAALTAVGSAQLLSLAELASLPSSTVASVPLGVGNQTVSAPTKRRARQINARGACDALPLGSGPTPTPDTDTAFLADPYFPNAALAASTPSGWFQTFQNLQGATSTASYITYKTYAAYNPSQCAADCTALTGCASFNIFFERSPSIDPADSCPTPSSTTVIKCSFWGVTIGPSTATNVGQNRNKFHVVIAGSNGYQLQAPVYDVAGYNATFTNAATINAPTECNSYITYKAHVNQPYDPALCAADCAAQRLETTPFNGLTCRYFTTYTLVKNGIAQAQICALYSRSWDKSYATNTGYTSGSDVYTIQYAYSYTFQADIGTFTCPQGGSGSTPTSSSIDTLSTVVASSTPSSSPSSTPSTTPSNDGPTGPLTSCPSPLSYVVGNNGGLYAVCAETDFQIPSPQIYYGYTSNKACATACQSQAGCTKAVYNPSTKTCYLKGSPSVAASNWNANKGFQTLVRVPDNTPLTQCLAPTYTVTVGSTTYTVCPSSDMVNNPAKNIWYLIPNDLACAALCKLTSGCTKAVYNPSTWTCYSKGNPTFANSGWHVDSSFRTIYCN
ncbi:hypothetical protein C8035_v003473 [Colletotrichum spinosum]|uniref:Apple domain-containing protein n=1 Tax=Colletotrichum spinosum TaxID=1347390 RepID=A0A4R8Q8B1_9PEZI|nr:hypothetical protein C8035_v003473 [Colletotrichum spinosum]